ncbi:hypothetical protein DFH29DRAFT_938684 [Suillus ampliporus]|nr:hypothetical protein DFH29DRAFT_938684 [Suillus ampliporus]
MGTLTLSCCEMVVSTARCAIMSACDETLRTPETSDTPLPCLLLPVSPATLVPPATLVTKTPSRYIFAASNVLRSGKRLYIATDPWGAYQTTQVPLHMPQMTTRP